MGDNAAVMELVFMHDSKSCDRKVMWVRVPPAAFPQYETTG